MGSFLPTSLPVGYLHPLHPNRLPNFCQWVHLYKLPLAARLMLKSESVHMLSASYFFSECLLSVWISLPALSPSLPLLYFILISQFPISVLFFFLMSYALFIIGRLGDNTVYFTVPAYPEEQMLGDQSPTCFERSDVVGSWHSAICHLQSYSHGDLCEELVRFVLYAVTHLIYHTSWNLSHAVRRSGVI